MSSKHATPDPGGVEFSIAPVPKGVAVLGIKQDQAFRHDFECVKECRVGGTCLPRGAFRCSTGGDETALGLAQLGHILVGGDPTPVRHHAIGDRDEPAILKFCHLAPFGGLFQRSMKVSKIGIRGRTLGISAADQTLL
jgi:hypothetical protein